MIVLNKRIDLISRPGKLGPSIDNFGLSEVKIGPLKVGEVLLKTLFLSLDPYMRARMYVGENYAHSADLNEPMLGGTISEVIETKNPDYLVGDVVESWHGWQTHHICTPENISRITKTTAPVSASLGVLGMPGLTGYGAMITHGRPVAGETVVVSAASGAVGSVAAQVAKIKGARVIGIAGGAEKCKILIDEFGLAGAVDHKSPNLAANLEALCPDGVDVYFDNVGGEIFASILPLMNKKGRVLVCGTISVNRDQDDPIGKDRMQWVLSNVLIKQLSITGFLFDDFVPLADQFQREASDWITSGSLQYREHIVSGIENAPEAFLSLFDGRNVGKLLVRP